MNPAWSVVFLTTLIGAGQGLVLALYTAELAGAGADGAARAFLAQGAAVAVLLAAAGLAASFFHLGRPARAWRSAAMWRTSWLSREVIALP
ncbi:MAG: dimethyl sulfoxide reductase anchor subunit, partial [Burkholderiales bacterium]|nr:dimethyl sulfoxide reductase anchor subunit [Burkholderiales bacterium]